MWLYFLLNDSVTIPIANITAHMPYINVKIPINSEFGDPIAVNELISVVMGLYSFQRACPKKT